MQSSYKIKFLAFLAIIVFSLPCYSQEAYNSEEASFDSSFSEESSTLSLDKVNQSNFHSTAVIQALNKITAKTSVLEIKVNEETKFGKLTIIARKCWKASPDQKPDNKILLEVYENSSESENAKKQGRIFYGWMISSSPSISDLEHPIYDITAINCKR